MELRLTPGQVGFPRYTGTCAILEPRFDASMRDYKASFSVGYVVTADVSGRSLNASALNSGPLN